MYTPFTMPGLTASLRALEIDQLRQVALAWGLEAEGIDKPGLLLILETEIQQPESFASVFERLPEAAQQAILALKAHDGRLAWSTFAQRFGEIRALGKNLRKKEQPWAFPASTSETLWYHGLLGRDFLRVADQLQEMAYLPEELLPVVPEVEMPALEFKLNPIKLPENYIFSTATTAVLDSICILLAAWRFDNPSAYMERTNISDQDSQILEALLFSIGLIDPERKPTDLARKFLELSRNHAISWLGTEWLNSEEFHELSFLPELKVESQTPVRSQAARQSLVAILLGLQADQWYSIDTLVEMIRKSSPEFLREQEEYFSWTVVDESNPQQMLIGFESWLPVEGRLVDFMVLRMLPLLGMVDTAGTDPDNRQLFRLNMRFFQILAGVDLAEDAPEEEPFKLTSTGKIHMTDRSPRIVRYQVSRFVDWLEVSPQEGTYQITPESLLRAGKQGLLPRHLVKLLRNHAAAGLPPVLYEAIKCWEKEGAQASIQTQVILRLGSPELLPALRESGAGIWLGESLGPTAVIVKTGGEKAVAQALVNLGYLTDYNESENKHG